MVIPLPFCGQAVDQKNDGGDHKTFECWIREHHDYSHGAGGEVDQVNRCESSLLLSMG